MLMYKGERISDLLKKIEVLEQTMDRLADSNDPFDVSQGYATLAIAKAKLKSLQGESNGTQKESR